jgi:hypothetical protein
MIHSTLQIFPRQLLAFMVDILGFLEATQIYLGDVPIIMEEK